MNGREEAVLRAELAALQAENQRLREHLAELAGQLQAATARVAELEQGTPPRRRFGKAASERPSEPRVRRPRPPEQDAGRPRAEPTACVQHQYEHCPDCGYRLGGGSVWWQREVVDLPPPVPLVVTEHTFVRRWCPACHKWCVPPLPPDLTLGQGRLGRGSPAWWRPCGQACACRCARSNSIWRRCMGCR